MLDGISAHVTSMSYLDVVPLLRNGRVSSGPGGAKFMRRVDSLEKTHAGRDWGQEE